MSLGKRSFTGNYQKSGKTRTLSQRSQKQTNNQKASEHTNLQQ